MTPYQSIRTVLAGGGEAVLTGVPEGLDALLLADTARALPGKPLMHIARDDQRLAMLAAAVRFYAPELRIVSYPAWDCLPYDRVSPSTEIIAQRTAALAQLSEADIRDQPLLLLTTANAVIQRTPPRQLIENSGFSAAPGASISLDKIQAFLTLNGFSRTGTVVEPGDFAIRGGIVDIFPPGEEQPIRLDFFGDQLESIRRFDAQTQRSIGQMHRFDLQAANEVLLNDDSVARFRTGYTATFGRKGTSDALYDSISQQRRFQGMEHWLPLFYDQLSNLFDFAGDCSICLDPLSEDSFAARRQLIEDYYTARIEAGEQQTYGAAPYNPLPPEALYLSEDELAQHLAKHPRLALTPFELPDADPRKIIPFGGRIGRNFAAERAGQGGNLYDALKAHIDAARKTGARVVIAAWSEGARERIEIILKDNDIGPIGRAQDWPQLQAFTGDVIGLIVLGLEAGFETDDLVLIAEQDVLGDRLVRRARRQKKASDFISELSALSPGDLVVHVEHGIGRFEGLKTIEVQEAPHDCLFLSYHGGDRLFLPVENIELLSRYGSEEAGAQLDRLGGAAWQARKARLKERIKEIAEDLIKTAAARELRSAETLRPPEGLYDEFAARFPYAETEDQLSAIDAVLEDLQTGRPMDRLICGDVGFGKTEVALRSAFIAVMAGKQVAVIVPTTLLARQHYATFATRFQGYPVNIAQASRLVGRGELERIKEGMKSGEIDIVIGTHALLAQGIGFHDLGLLVIDEEQHFGVKHKERLKELKADVHVLTLTATPIPRTLQLALTGVRELSLITTPPLDRLAIRTFISPFDPVVVRETLLRELYRGGQSFYVAPRISDLAEVSEFLADYVPEVKVAVAHGRMAPTQLEDIMTGFYDRQYDVLLATTIIESGLDIPTANTLIVHRADMFGLAQLYQIRGRIGRSKQRAYALLTTPSNKRLTDAAQKRLEVLQSLDSLGAGFTLASHDLDQRGAGNLLGEEQSGHVREVGYELYQSMLEEAVANLRTGDKNLTEDTWSPQISIGTSVLIPESYVEDLQLRLGLYRRLADVKERDEITAFAAELHDRFGPLPEEVEQFLEIVAIKLLCRQTNVASVDAGPKGAVLGFHNQEFPAPDKLIEWIGTQGARAKLRPDMRLVIMRNWDLPEHRLAGAKQILGQLAQMVAS